MDKTVVYKWHQSFFGLSCVSPNEVSNGFVVLMSDAPVHVAETFTDYILETFIDENSSFPPYLWAESPSSIVGQQMGPKRFMKTLIVSFIRAIQIVLV